MTFMRKIEPMTCETAGHDIDKAIKGACEFDCVLGKKGKPCSVGGPWRCEIVANRLARLIVSIAAREREEGRSEAKQMAKPQTEGG